MGSDFGNFQSLLMRSEDGINWEMVVHPSYKEAHLEEIYFPSENVGYVVGGANWENPVPYLLKTTDGGSTWEELPNPVEKGWLADVYFDDENTGWVVGGESGEEGDEGIIAMTTDGGATWEVTQQSGEIVFLNNILEKDDMLFASGNRCDGTDWATGCSGVLWSSNDFGKTWHELGELDKNPTRLRSGSVLICATSFEQSGEPSLLIVSSKEISLLKDLSESPGLVVVSP